MRWHALVNEATDIARDGFRPGVVLGSSDKAASVRYRPTEGRGTAVDTVLPHKIVPRDDDDPDVDGQK